MLLLRLSGMAQGLAWSSLALRRLYQPLRPPFVANVMPHSGKTLHGRPGTFAPFAPSHRCPFSYEPRIGADGIGSRPTTMRGSPLARYLRLRMEIFRLP